MYTRTEQIFWEMNDPRQYVYKNMEGNNRPSAVNQISLVHNHDKAGNKRYTQDNTNTRETPSVIIGAAEE